MCFSHAGSHGSKKEVQGESHVCTRGFLKKTKKKRAFWDNFGVITTIVNLCVCVLVCCERSLSLIKPHRAVRLQPRRKAPVWKSGLRHQKTRGAFHFTSPLCYYFQIFFLKRKSSNHTLKPRKISENETNMVKISGTREKTFELGTETELSGYLALCCYLRSQQLTSCFFSPFGYFFFFTILVFHSGTSGGLSSTPI